mgnify:CR=1 FL=1
MESTTCEKNCENDSHNCEFSTLVQNNSHGIAYIIKFTENDLSEEDVEEIMENVNSVKLSCICGSTISAEIFYKHVTSKKHQNFINQPEIHNLCEKCNEEMEMT